MTSNSARMVIEFCLPDLTVKRKICRQKIRFLFSIVLLDIEFLCMQVVHVA